MSRPSMMPPRNLTLMEELEKLEQSITLILQGKFNLEIDHNFSRAHRIVTTTILTVVEQYAKHSNSVWQGSEFWKGFFEASANVKLSSYEEPVGVEETLEGEETQTLQDHEYGTSSTRTGDEDTTTTPQERPKFQYQGSSPVAAEDRSDITPQKPARPAEETSFAEFPSPYETLKREMNSTTTTSRSKKPPTSAHVHPSTPGFPRLHPTDTASDRNSSPFIPTTTVAATARRIPLNIGVNTTTNIDPLLHRVLDKNYRIQATPLASHRQPLQSGVTDNASSAYKGNAILDFSSPFSPPAAAPQLRAEIFGSPMARGGPGIPRTPGISVQRSIRKSRIPTPRQRTGGDTANLFGQDRARAQSSNTRLTYDNKLWDSDSDTAATGDDTLGISPPKTMQFHIPASRLLRTPAREASKKIVDELMTTAGVALGSGGSDVGGFQNDEVEGQWGEDELDLDLDLDLGDDEDGDDEDSYHRRNLAADDDSPSVVRVARRDADADAF